MLFTNPNLFCRRSRGDLLFDLDQFDRLNKEFKRRWPLWIKRAPPAYHLPIFDSATPLSLIILYGQNRIVCRPPVRPVDAAFWRKDLDPLQFSRLEFALATHYM